MKKAFRNTLPDRRIALGLIILTGILLAPPSAISSQTVRLQLKWDHQFQFAGYYAAQEQGYYEAAGLDVEILPAQQGKDPMQQVVQGKAEFGVGTTDLLLLREQGVPVVALAAIFQHSPQALMVLKQDGVQSIHDLVNNNVMMEPGSAELQAYLNKEGISADKFTQVHHQFNTEALLNGTVKALSVYVSDEPFILKEAQMDYLLYSPRAVGIDFYGDTLFTTEQQINQNPETVKAFREASLKGWDYAMQHPEELVQLIHAHYSQRHSIEHLRFEAAQMAPLMQAGLVKIGHMNPGRWHHIAQIYTELGLMEADFDIADFLYNPHPPSPDLSRLYGILGITTATTLLILALAIYAFRINRRLRRDNQTITAAKNALRESTTKYKALYNNAPLAYQSLDENGCFLDINPAWLNTLGYERNEVIGTWFGDYLHPDYKPKFEKKFAHFKACGSVREVQFLIRHKQGHYRRIEFEGCAGYHPDGRFKQIYCVFQDITKQHETQEALKQSEQNFRAMIETLPLAICLTSEIDQVSEYMNPAFTDLFGYTSEDIPSVADWFPLAYPDETYREQIETEWTEKVQKAISTRSGIEPLETVVTCKDGSTKIIHWGYRATSEKNYAYGLDITESKKAKQKLRKSLDRLQKISDQVPGVIYEFRLRPDDSFCFSYASDKIREIYRVTPEQVKENASDAFEVIHPDDYAGVVESIQISARDLTPWKHEYRVKFDDETVRWLFGQSVPQKEPDGSVLWHGFITDITERKNTEEKLHARNLELERFNKASVGRELRMIELKKEINALNREFGKEEPYSLCPSNNTLHGKN